MRIVTLLALVACGPSQPVLGDLERVVPGPGLPSEVVPQDANNNLDVIDVDGTLFLAFRTAPSHFASPLTTMYVVSSTDGGATWAFETQIAKGTDVREPNFVAADGALYLYYAVLGDNPLDFAPQGAERITRTGPGQWSDPEPAFDGNFIPWRAKQLGPDTPVGDPSDWMVLGYVGGENIYDPGGDPIRIEWLRSSDGVTWEPFQGDDPVVQTGGGSETDLLWTPDGGLVAVTRNEAGDEAFGFGSKICRAEPDALMDWHCERDDRKYDSPLMFAAEGRYWLVARRNRTDDGAYDLGQDDLPLADRAVAYQWAYWNEPKRCSLWEVDPDTQTVAFVLDLPSRGDTCFPELVEVGGERVVYNYSSDPAGPDWDWIEGQEHPTDIYRIPIGFER